MTLCKYINCGERVAIDELCGPHYNSNREYEEEKKNRILLSPAQIKRAEEQMKQLDIEAIEEMTDLEWWLSVYGDSEKPAKFMNKYYYILINWDNEQGEPDKGVLGLAELKRNESRLLNERLKELEGTVINGTHIWRFTGKKHFMREGTHNHFRCEPLGKS